MKDKDKLLENKLEEIKNSFIICIKENANQFADDTQIMYELIENEKYRFVKKDFYDYFNNKYDLKDIHTLIEDFDQLFILIFNRCVVPNNLLLDMSCSSSDKSYFRNIWKCFINFKNRWTGFSLIVIILIFILFSFHFYINEEMWWSNFFIGVVSGIVAALIISYINKKYRYRMYSIDLKKKRIDEEITLLKESFEKEYNKFVELSLNNDLNMIESFCEINNILHRHINWIKSITDIKIFSCFKDLIKFEKSIFDYSRNIIRNKYFNKEFMFLESDKSKMKIDIFMLKKLLNKYYNDVNNLKDLYEREMIRIKEKNI